MDKAPTPGYCPHCKNELKNAGATACTECGAFETTAWDQLGLWRNSILAGCFVLSPVLGFLIAFNVSGVAGLVVWIGAMVGYFVFRSMKKKKKVWAVGGRRII